MTLIGLLIVTSLSKISTSLRAAQKYLFNTLYVQIYSPQQQQHSINSIPSYSNIISKIYASSLCHTDNVDIRVIVENLKTNKAKKFDKKIDIVLFDNCFPAEETTRLSTSYGTSTVVNLSDDADPQELKFEMEAESPEDLKKNAVYDNVVLGGTFDRIHVGHKILLTEAVLRARKRLVVGVTDVNMIKSKKLRELVQPVQQRIDDVHDFLKDIDNTLEYDIVPIQDAYGPTRTDPNLELLVVSAETKRGGDAVNRVRSESNLKPLEIHCIDLIETDEDQCDEIKEIKISSSNRRFDLLGTLIREPENKSNIPRRPYVIGLVGGIASGKSDLSKRLESLGAQVIDCDKLAHQLYEPGEECYDKVIQCFGKHVVHEENGQINRQKLGEIVFGNPAELNKLNEIVWPSLLKLAKIKITERFEATNCDVLILEAAVLLKAGWQTECHEIWSTILPRDEAIKRLMARNNLTEDEAKKRIDSQENNEEMVKHSNVVFSSQYGFKYSQGQVDRAWRLLMKRIKTKPIPSGKL